MATKRYQRDFRELELRRRKGMRMLARGVAQAEVELEIADVLLFLLRLCDKLGIDPVSAAGKKLVLNAERYPVAKARGKATKYNKLS